MQTHRYSLSVLLLAILCEIHLGLPRRKSGRFIDEEVEAVYPEPGRYEEKYADYEAEYYDNDVFKNKEPNEEDILEDLDTVCNDVVEDFDLKPEITRSDSQAATRPLLSPFVFGVVGGYNQEGAVTTVEVLDLGNSAPVSAELHNLPRPVKYEQTTTGCSAAYTQEALTYCTQGSAVLTPYGWLYSPGTCQSLPLSRAKADWVQTGGALTMYRKGGTINRMGRFLIALGGQRKGRAVRSVELLDTSSPGKGWKRSARLTLPTAASQHCSVVLGTKNGREIVLTGGKGNVKRGLKLDMKANKWFNIASMSTGRRHHACTSTTINGRKGLVVSGGITGNGTNTRTVEFYDLETDKWVRLPSMRQPRREHAMSVINGHLTVTGGVVTNKVRNGKSARMESKVVASNEIFDGKQWRSSEFKLAKPRQRFSIVRVPRNLFKR